MNIAVLVGGRPVGLSRCSDSLLAGRSRDRIPMEARFSTPVRTGPGAHRGYFSPGVKRLGCGVDYPPPCSAEVKENVVLDLCPRVGRHGTLCGDLSLYLPYVI
jgi:hypothetical protein